jgi:hypothetical protein
MRNRHKVRRRCVRPPTDSRLQALEAVSVTCGDHDTTDVPDHRRCREDFIYVTRISTAKKASSPMTVSAIAINRLGICIGPSRNPAIGRNCGLHK